MSDILDPENEKSNVTKISKTKPKTLFGETSKILEHCEVLKNTFAHYKNTEPKLQDVLIKTLSFAKNGDEFINKNLKPFHGDLDFEQKQTEIAKLKVPPKCLDINRPECEMCTQRGTIESPAWIVGKRYYENENIGFCTISERTQRLMPHYPGLKNKLIDELGLIYDIDQDNLYTFNKTHYEKLHLKILESHINAYTFEKFNSPNKHETVSRIKSEAKIIRKIDWFNESTKNLINFKNCVVDISTRKTLPHSQKYGFLYCFDVDYEPDLKPEQLLTMIGNACNYDDDACALLSEVIAVSTLPSPAVNKIFIFDGQSQTGKTTLVNAMRLVQPHNASIGLNDLVKMERRNKLVGSFFNVSDEENRESFGEEIENFLKIMASGSTANFRSLNKDNFEAKITAKQLILTNNLPSISGDRKSMLNRMIILKFNRVYEDHEKIDPDIINAKILSEKKEILSWLISIYYKWVDRGNKFTYSQSAADELTFYKENSSPVHELIHDLFEYCEGSEITKKKVHEVFSTKLKEIGLRELSPTWIGRELVKAFPKINKSDMNKRRQTNTGEVERVMRNLRIKGLLL